MMHYYYTYQGTNQAGSVNKNRKGLIRFIFIITLVSVSFSLGTLVNVFAKADMDAYENPSSMVVQSMKHSERIMVDVQSGDTIWGIAQQYAPEQMDVRKYVHQILKLNQLESPNIQVGQVLIMP